VVFALRHEERIALDSVDQAVRVIDAPGPEPRQLVFERFRLSGALERLALAFLQGEQPAKSC